MNGLLIPARCVTWLVGLTILVAPVPSAGQLSPAGAAHLGLAETSIAQARGFEAVALNPANLGLRTNPPFSITVFSPVIRSGLDPVGLGDIAGYAGESVPIKTREEWLRSIVEAGAETGGGSIDIGLLGLTVGPFGIQVSNVRTATAHLDPAAAELLLFGNAGREGAPRPLASGGASVDVLSFSTVALSYGFRIPFDLALLYPDESIAVGLTAKYTGAHMAAVVRDAASNATTEPLAIDVLLPAVETRSDAGFVEPGGGFGLDAGLAWEGGPFAVSAVVRNVLNTFQLDTTGLVYRPNQILFTGEEEAAAFDVQGIAFAPASLLAVVDELGFAPEMELGLTTRLGDALTMTGSFRHRLGEGIGLAPASQGGVGVEYRGTDWLALRAGGTILSGGFQMGGGASLGWAGLSLGGAAAYLSGDNFKGSLAALSLAFVLPRRSPPAGGPVEGVGEGGR